MSKMIMIAGGAILLLGGGGAGLYFTGVIGGEEAEAAAPTPATLPAAILELEPFLTNINPGGKHAARLKVNLVISPEERVAEIQADTLLMARMRDSILSLLTSKTFDDLNSPDGKQAFRAELQEKLTEQVGGDNLREVLFHDFIVQ